MSDVSVLGEYWECGCALCVRRRAERALDAAKETERRNEERRAK